MEVLAHIESHLPQLEKELQEEVKVQKEWGSKWSRLFIEKNEGQFTEELKVWAVNKMTILINTLQPILDGIE